MPCSNLLEMNGDPKMSRDLEEKMSSLLTQLEQGRLCKPGEARGATEQEIDRLEREIGLPLPAAYKSYLRAVGKGAGDFLCGTDIFLPQVPGIRDDAVEVLHQLDPSLQLPPDAFVFGHHQGYVFYYMRTDPADDDPPVYCFTDDASPRQVSSSFTGFLTEMADQDIKTVDATRLLKGYNDNRKANPAVAYEYAVQYVSHLAQFGESPPDWIARWLEEYRKLPSGTSQ
jgi:hypothetical protein